MFGFPRGAVWPRSDGSVHRFGFMTGRVIIRIGLNIAAKDTEGICARYCHVVKNIPASVL